MHSTTRFKPWLNRKTRLRVFDDVPVPFTTVARCRPHLHRILAQGGSAAYFDGKQSRELEHSPAIHGPGPFGLGLSGLLSLFQRHKIALRFYEGNVADKDLTNIKPVFERLYSQWTSEMAIIAFLQGADPAETVIIIDY